MIEKDGKIKLRSHLPQFIFSCHHELENKICLLEHARQIGDVFVDEFSDYF